MWVHYHLDTLKSQHHTLVFMTYDEAFQRVPDAKLTLSMVPILGAQLTCRPKTDSDRFDL